MIIALEERFSGKFGVSLNPAVAVDPSSNLHAAWSDYKDEAHWQVYYKCKDSSGWSPDGEAHLVWRDMRDGNHGIY